jgi:hypothetical protein
MHRGGGAFRCGVANLFRSQTSRPLGREEIATRLSPMQKDYLILKRASVSRSSGQWSDDDFDVLAEGVVVMFGKSSCATESNAREFAQVNWPA